MRRRYNAFAGLDSVVRQAVRVRCMRVRVLLQLALDGEGKLGWRSR